MEIKIFFIVVIIVCLVCSFVLIYDIIAEAREKDATGEGAEEKSVFEATEAELSVTEVVPPVREVVTEYKKPYEKPRVNAEKTNGKSDETRRGYTSEYLILPSEYYRLPQDTCFYYDELVRHALSAGGVTRRKIDGGEEIETSDNRRIRIEIKNYDLRCSGVKITDGRSLEKAKNAVSAAFAKA